MEVHDPSCHSDKKGILHPVNKRLIIIEIIAKVFFLKFIFLKLLFLKCIVINLSINNYVIN